jgi:predicted porin
VYANNGVVTDGSYNFGTTNNQRAITLGAQYVNGPVQVVATYDQVMPQDNLPGGTASTPKSWILGGSYDFKVVKASLAYGQTRGGWVTGTQPINGSGVNPSWTNGGVLFTDGFGANSYLVGLTAPINAQSKAFASYQAANPTGNLTDSGAAQSVYSVGYSYDFSKRTSAYAYASYANNYAMIDGVKSTALGVGVRHAF